MDDVKNYLEYTIKLLVSHPDYVQVKYSNDELGTLAEVQVAKEDMGKVIGREGELINNIRKVVRAVGMSHSVKMSIKIVEPA